MSQAAGDAQAEVVIGNGEASFDHAQAALERMRALNIPGLLVPSGLSMGPDGAVTARLQAAGEPLDGILAARAGLSAGECVWWGSEVARILGELHRHGVVHGAVDCSNVLIDGRVVRLIAVPRLQEGEPKAPDDIQALGAVLDSAVKLADAMLVHAWTEPMRHPEPGARPSAAMVAHALRSCAPPTPITAVEQPIASRLRGRWQQAREVAADAVQPSKAAPSKAAPNKAAPSKAAPVALPGSNGWRMRRWLISLPKRRVAVPPQRGWAVMAWAIVCACVALLVAGPVVARGTGGGQAPSAAALAHASEGTPAGAARSYVAGRLCALAGGQTEAWLAGIVPGSEAMTEADARLAERDAGGLSVAAVGSSGEGMGCGLLAAPPEVTEVEPQGDDVATVLIRVPTAAHVATTARGSIEYAEGVLVMELRLSRMADGRWLVESAGVAA